MLIKTADFATYHTADRPFMNTFSENEILQSTVLLCNRSFMNGRFKNFCVSMKPLKISATVMRSSCIRIRAHTCKRATEIFELIIIIAM